ncbi:ubiquinone-dependent pyruvate dehydrogenase, partial [Pseudomonas syringae]
HRRARGTHPGSSPGVLELARGAASTPKEVGVRVLPGDLGPSAAPDAAARWIEATAPNVVPADNDLQSMAHMLNDSKAATLLCGAGCEGAHEQVLALADTLGAPSVHALRGKQHGADDNPFDVAPTGLLGLSSGCHALLSSDTLVLLRRTFPHRTSCPDSAVSRPS